MTTTITWSTEKKVGRPWKGDERRNGRLVMRVNDAELEAIREGAKRARLDVSTYARKVALDAAEGGPPRS